jgi:hypothetical protein
MEPLTMEVFQSVLPDQMKKSVNQQLLDQINATLAEPELYEAYRDNLLSYTRVMKEGRWQIAQYLSACRYATHKLMGDSNIDAYTKTFPDKIARFTAQGVAPKDISSYVTAYNKSQLVMKIMEQTMVPTHVLNQDLYQRALNVQADLMMNAKSEKVRSDAANSILTQLKAPETVKMQMDVAVTQGSEIAQLRQATLELAKQQQLMIQVGAMNAQQVAHQRIQGEVVDVQAVEVQP